MIDIYNKINSQRISESITGNLVSIQFYGVYAWMTVLAPLISMRVLYYTSYLWFKLSMVLKLWIMIWSTHQIFVFDTTSDTFCIFDCCVQNVLARRPTPHGNLYCWRNHQQNLFSHNSNRADVISRILKKKSQWSLWHVL